MKETAAQLGNSFHALSGVQKAGLAVIGAVTVGALAWIGFGNSAGRFKAIAHDLSDPGAATTLAKRLEANGIQARVTDGGRTVEVPDSQLAGAARIASERDAMPKRHQAMMAEIVKKNSMLLSTEERRMLNLRALESRLEDNIETYEMVERASVNLSLPPEHAFASERGAVKANIILTLRAGVKTGRDFLRTIRAGVSHAIDGLLPENISISDSLGNDLSRSVEEAAENAPDSLLAYQQLCESDLAAKARSILKPLFGEENLHISVTAQVRPESVLSRPARAVTARPGPQVRLASLGNLGATEAAVPVAISVATTSDVSHFGRLSVSVLINSNAYGKGALPEELRRTAERLVMAAVGFSAARNDVVSVLGAPFRQSLAPVAVPVPLPAMDLLAPYANHIWAGATGALVLLLFGVLRWTFPPGDGDDLIAESKRDVPSKGTLLDLSTREIQALMATDGKRDLAVVLSASPQPMRNFVIDRIAVEDREIFSAQIGVLGTTSVTEVHQARVRIFRRLNRDDDGSRPEHRRMN